MNKQSRAMAPRFFFKALPRSTNQASIFGCVLRSQGSIRDSMKGITRSMPPAQTIQEPNKLCRNKKKLDTTNTPTVPRVYSWPHEGYPLAQKVRWLHKNQPS